MKRIFTITCLMIVAVSVLHAQDMKKINVRINAQATGFNHAEGEGSRGVLYAAPELQVQYNFNRFFSAGLVYSRSVSSWVDISFNDQSGVSSDQVESEYQSFGIIAEAGTNRVRRLRFYVLGFASSTEMADHYSIPSLEDGTFSISRTGLCYGAGMGLSVKVTRGFTLNLFEIKGSYNPGTLSYINENKPYYGVSCAMGFTMHFLREK